MSDRDNETLDQAIDPPENQGGGGSALSLDSTSTDQQSIDPPENQGGGTE